MKLKYVVTGTGRSGTVYMARLLTSVGVLCGHESVFDVAGLEGAARRLSGEKELELSFVSQARKENGEWKNLSHWLPDLDRIEADASYMAVPFLGSDLLADAKVIHVVRNPVKVVNSFCNYINYFSQPRPTNHYEDFIFQHASELRSPMTQYDRGCLFWVLWNERVANPDLFYRVEDAPEAVLKFLGADGPYFEDRSVNSLAVRGAERFTIDKIRSDEIRQRFVTLGRRYGYPMLSEYLLA